MSMTLMGGWFVSLYKNDVETLLVKSRGTQGKVMEERYKKDYFSLGFLIRTTLRIE